MEKKKLYFALLNKGWLRREFSSVQLPAMLKTEGVELLWESPEKTWGHPIYSNRNAIVKRFLATDCDFLLMQDDDVVPLHNPAELVCADLDIIGFSTKVRQENGRLNWVAYMEQEGMDGYFAVDLASSPTNTDLLTVDVVGTGCILIKRKVLETIKAPFLVENDEDGIIKYGTDFAFCRRAKAAGFNIYTTRHRFCEHYKEMGMLEMTGYDDSDFFCTDNRKYEIPWGDWAILQKDWKFIRSIIQAEGLKNIVEFGTGLSSLVVSEIANVVSYETQDKTIEEITGKILPENKLEIRKWDGVTPPDIKGFDLVFIDGPRGGVGIGRKASYQAAAESGAKFIITHDSGRIEEQTFSRMYLWKDYEIVGREGLHIQRCELWMKKSEIASGGEKEDVSKPV